MKVTVFGSGGWGTAIALLLCDNGNEVTLWTKFDAEAAVLHAERKNPLLPGIEIPEGIHITTCLDEAVKDIGAAVIATPSFAVRETAAALRGRLSRDCIVICMSKGIEKDTTSLFSVILREALGDEAAIVSVSGPTHAEEVARRIPTACVAASKDKKAAERVQILLMNGYFRVYTTDDVIGVELGAALKNVIALCAGICDGLGLGDNTIAMLMTRGLSEVASLCVALGGRKDTLAGLAGLGDLIVTCTSRHSRNRRAGVLIGQGDTAEEAMKKVGAVVEGYYAAKAANELAERAGADMPICREAYRVLYEDKPPMEAIRELMNRARKSESPTGGGLWVTQ